MYSADDAVPFNLVELGAGDGRKTAILLRHFVQTNRRFAYTSIDISAGALRSQAARMRAPATGLDLSLTSPLHKVTLLAGDNIQSIQSLTAARKHGANSTKRGYSSRLGDAGRLVVTFLGSSIGNFNNEQISQFLADLWMSMSNGDLLMVGFDLRKPPSIISHAYNDSALVTSEFNKNLLRRVNTQLQGNFDVDEFTFHSWYDSVTGAVKSTLVSHKDQTVSVGALGRTFHFDAWEALDTEMSRKFTLAEVESYAKRVGFEVVQHFKDERGWFLDSLWRTVKTN